MCLGFTFSVCSPVSSLKPLNLTKISSNLMALDIITATAKSNEKKKEKPFDSLKPVVTF